MKPINAVSFVVALVISTPAFPCSFAQVGSFRDSAGGQNFDFPPVISAGLVVNKRNVAKTDGSFEGAPAAPQARWISKYGSVTFGFGRENPVTGVNEAGLRVYRFLFLEARYPQPNRKPAINESQYVQYLLDTAQSVDDVIQRTNAVQIYALAAPTHFAACDRQAKCVFIEAMNGTLRIFRGPEARVNVMTNTDYAKSLGLMDLCPSGDCPIIRDNSDQRFVKAAALVRGFAGRDVLAGAFNVLDSVKQTGPQVATLWSLLNHGDNYYVQNTRFSRTVLALNLKTLDFSCRTPVQVAFLQPGDARPLRLTDYTLGFQQDLSEVVHRHLGVSAADKQKRIEYPAKFTRCLE